MSKFEISTIRENVFSFASHYRRPSNLEEIKHQINDIMRLSQFEELSGKNKLHTIRRAFITVNFSEKTFSFIQSAELSGDYVILTETSYGIAFLPGDEIGQCELSGEFCHISQLTEVRESEESTELFWVKKTFNDDDLSCPECGEFLLSHKSELVRTESGEIFCSSDCAHENGFEQCAHCGKWEQDAVFIEKESECYCENCINRLFERCEHCGEYIRRSEAIIANDESIFCCFDCLYAADYHACDGCGEYFHYDDLNYSERRDRYFCSDCYESEENDVRSRLIGYRHEKPTTFLKTEDDIKGSTLFLGTEDEQEFNDIDDFSGVIDELLEISNSENELIVLKEDGSLNDLGMEIVTLPISLNWYKIPENAEKFKEIFRILNAYKAVSSKNCGMHVHMSRAGITEEHEIKMEMFFQRHRENLYIIAGRGENGYAKFSTGRDLSDKENFKAKNCASSRYRALNWRNSRTVEIRIFAAVSEFSAYMKNIEFSHCFYQYTKTADLEKIETADFSDFLEFAKNSGVYPYFSEFIEENF